MSIKSHESVSKTYALSKNDFVLEISYTNDKLDFVRFCFKHSDGEIERMFSFIKPEPLTILTELIEEAKRQGIYK